MDIQTKLYGSVAIIRLLGSIKAPEMLVLRLEIEKKCKSLAVVLVSIESNDIEKAAINECMRIRELEKSSKAKVKIVALTLEGADAQDIPTALEQIDSFEAQNVVQIIERSHNIDALKTEFELTKREICKLLSIAPDTAQEQFEIAISKIRGESNKQRYLLKALETEIEHLKKKKKTTATGTTTSNEQIAQIDSIRKRALSALKSGGAI